MKKIVLFYILIAVSLPIFSQSKYITGKTIDAKTGKPLPFVNITYNEKGYGMISDIDGNFSMRYIASMKYVKFSYVGYETKILNISKLNLSKKIYVSLKQKSVEIEEVVVFPGVNPAHRIIKKCVKNRKINNPEKMHSFKYTSYNKMIFTLNEEQIFKQDSIRTAKKDSLFNIKLAKVRKKGLDSLSIKKFIALHKTDQHHTIIYKNDTLQSYGIYSYESDGKVKRQKLIYKNVVKLDTLTFAQIDSIQEAYVKKNTEFGVYYKNMSDFVSNQYIFLMETVSERKFKRPNRNYEKITASRVSGLKNPEFVLLATQMQSFSFYNDMITILGKKYLNPISRGSTRKYLFIIEDTTFTEKGDSVFVISYRPRKGKNFEGIRGVLNINTNTYAVQSVIAEPYKSQMFTDVKIRQKYEYIDNKQWFPVELITEISTGGELLGNTTNNDIQLNSSGNNTNNGIQLIGLGKTYINNIELNPKIKNRNFWKADVEVMSDANEKDESYWKQHRNDTLSNRDLKTYEVIDSVGKKANFDRYLKILKILGSGYIPYKYIKFDYSKIIDYNRYEGFRFGIPVETNEKVSRYFSVGGYAAFSFGNWKFNYGGSLKLTPFARKEPMLNLSYKNDVEETGGYRFHENRSVFSSEGFRKFLIADMFNVEEGRATLNLRLLNALKVSVYGAKRIVEYGKSSLITPSSEINKNYNISEAGVKIRFAPGEKIMKIAGMKIPFGNTNKATYIYANLSRGFKLLNGNFEYTRMVGKISKSFLTKNFGTTHISIFGGYVFGDVPVFDFFNGRGSYSLVGVDCANSFNTMRMSEFVSDKFASLYFKQDFASLLFKTKNFSPEISLITNVGWGELSKSKTEIFTAKSLENIYLESGVLINSLIKWKKIINYGIGLYYRYGYYKLPKVFDNLAFKLTFGIKI